MIMLPDALSEIASYSNIKSSVSLAGQDVDARLLLHKREDWIPAYAGMTGSFKARS